MEYFSTELEHSRAYLAVEKAQYEDSLIQQKNILLNRPYFNLFDAFLKAYLISPSTLSKKFDILEHPLEGRLENR